MKEYIEREAAKVKFRDLLLIGSGVCDILDEVPAADVAPVVHGEWVVVTKGILGKNYACSKCYILASEGNSGHNDILTPFCPYCGADMKGVAANE
jgi:hypothetical protein